MRPPSVGRVPLQYWLSLLVLGTLFLTNRYLFLPADATWVNAVAGDSYGYLAMAKAFPSLPADVSLPAHHAQRFFLPYVLGGVAWLVGAAAQDVFFPFAVLAILGVVLALHGIMDRLRLEPDKQMMLLVFLIANPYTFRYYVAIPWMVSDLGYHLGVAVLLLGLLRESPGWLFAGLLASALSKQTALLLIPGVMSWIWWEWTSSARAVRAVRCGGVALTGVAVYLGAAWLAWGFSDFNAAAAHVTGLFGWIRTDFSLAELVGFVLRGVVGFAFPAALLLSLMITGTLPEGWYRNRKFRLSLFLTGSVFLQPLLGGPAITDKSITRLAMLGYLPLLVGLGSLLSATSLSGPLQRRLVFLSAFVVAMSSFHHFYSFLGTPDIGRAGRFAVVYVISVALLFLGSLILQSSESSGRGG